MSCRSMASCARLSNLISVVRDAGPGRLNVTTTSTFDARGDPLTVTDPRGNVTTNSWDAGRRLATTTTPGTPGLPKDLVTTYTYDPAGAAPGPASPSPMPMTG